MDKAAMQWKPGLAGTSCITEAKKGRDGGGRGASGNPRDDNADRHGENRTAGTDNGGGGDSETDTLVLVVGIVHEGIVGATQVATGGSRQSGEAHNHNGRGTIIVPGAESAQNRMQA